MNKLQAYGMGLMAVGIMGIIASIHTVDDTILGMESDTRNKLFTGAAVLGGLLLAVGSYHQIKEK